MRQITVTCYKTKPAAYQKQFGIINPIQGLRISLIIPEASLRVLLTAVPFDRLLYTKYVRVNTRATGYIISNFHGRMSLRNKNVYVYLQ